MPKTAAPPVGVLASALRVAVVRLNRRLRYKVDNIDSAIATSGGCASVSMAQRAALFTLDRLGPMAPGALAAHEKVQPPSMTRVLAALEEKALVARRPHPSDGRQVIVELTRDGEALLEKEVRAREAWLCQQISGLPREDRETLQAAVEVINRLVDA